MTNYAALDVSLEATAVCVVDEEARILAEQKIPTCPDAIASWLAKPSLISFASGWRLVLWLCGCGTSCATRDCQRGFSRLIRRMSARAVPSEPAGALRDEIRSANSDESPPDANAAVSRGG